MSKGYVIFNDLNNTPETDVCGTKRAAFQKWVKSVTLEKFLDDIDNYSIVAVEYDDFAFEPMDEEIKVKDYLSNVYDISFGKEQ